MAFLSGLLPLLGTAVSALAPKVLPAIGEGIGRFAKGLEKGKGFAKSLREGIGLDEEPSGTAEQVPRQQVTPIRSVNDLNNERTISGIDNNISNRKLHTNRIASNERSLNRLNSSRALFKKLQKRNRKRNYTRYL